MRMRSPKSAAGEFQNGAASFGSRSGSSEEMWLVGDWAALGRLRCGLPFTFRPGSGALA